MIDNKNFDKNLADQQQLKQAFTKMYNSLATLNYCRGGSGGMAQQTALEQMTSFVKNRAKYGDAIDVFVEQLNANNRKIMSEHIMKSSFSDEVCTDAVAAKEWGISAVDELRTGIKIFTYVYEKYHPVSKNTKRNDLAAQIIKLVKDKTIKGL